MKRKIPVPHRESNPRAPIVQPIAQRYTDWAITALNHDWLKRKFNSENANYHLVQKLCLPLSITYTVVLKQLIVLKTSSLFLFLVIITRPHRMCFNAVFPSIPSYLKRFLPVRLFDHNRTCFSWFLHVSYMAKSFQRFRLSRRNIRFEHSNFEATLMKIFSIPLLPVPAVFVEPSTTAVRTTTLRLPQRQQRTGRICWCHKLEPSLYYEHPPPPRSSTPLYSVCSWNELGPGSSA
jgi:hypothetical protein